MLIPFPFAFLFGSLAFDAMGRWSGRGEWWRTARALQAAGIGAAAIAAVPGLLDYFYTVPPASSGKRRATNHLLSNLGAVSLFAAARLFRERESGRPGAACLALETAGAALMSVGGWLGGTLVYRNEIGVDVRQAGAGQWREETALLEEGRTFTAGRSEELEADQMKLVHVDGCRIVVARTAGTCVAFDDRCTHRGGSLAGGVLVGGTVQCPWHGSQFDVHTGRVRRGPAEEPIETYAVEERDGIIRVRLENA
jgi:nitrite reductase/ring-hydroxylating ferredoxin subunit/uncharacterized membrane protein